MSEVVSNGDANANHSSHTQADNCTGDEDSVKAGKETRTEEDESVKSSFDGEQSTTADSSADIRNNSETLAGLPTLKVKPVPSVEVSELAESGDDEASREGEADNNVLSTIEEEVSVATSVSELIDTEINQTSDNEIEESFAAGDLNKEEAKLHETIAFGDNSHSENRISEQPTTPDTQPAVDYVVMKENQVLKARITEINEQLHKSKLEIEEMRHTLDSYESSDKLIPKQMSSELENMETENAGLKQKVAEQNEKIQSASEEQNELVNRITKLVEEEETRARNLKQKQEEVERLGLKVTELNSVVQSLTSAQQEDAANENGMPATNTMNESVANSRTSLDRASHVSKSERTKRSKVCIIV